MQNLIDKLPAFRALCAIGLLACVGLIGFAFYLQYQSGLEPCPLCMAQRIMIYLAAGVLALGLILNPARGQRIYAGLVILFSLGGAALAGRQLWLQSLPEDQVPACGPGLDYMLEVLPLTEVISTMIRGTGDCAEVQWTFLTLSIPGWTLIAFVAFALLGLMLWFRRSI